ncbi:hypothetical protein [Deinococcus aquatilis]|jgi:hypothetical protein|uniref:hypothetical protein n=1 Tax=Deinococcus aquatilis TaxID=519440 RepID=UPI000381B018|nr:hypothetical protein [Deinococcus aquatilis]
MTHDEQVLAYFHKHFGNLTDSVFAETGQLDGYPAFLQLFWQRFGFGARADGFVWLLDPAEHVWVNALFDLDRRLIPFARTSFGDLHFLDPEGEGYSFSPSYQELQPMAVSLHSAVMSLGEPGYINDDPFYERHQELWAAGERIDRSSCFCLTPALPLGGDEVTSEVYRGDFQAYLTLLSQA